MIYMFNGTPGSGKSVHQAQKVYYKNLRKVPVIANYSVNLDHLKHPELFLEVDNSELTPQFLTQYAASYWSNHPFKEGGLCLMIDECQILYNARAWNQSNRNDWLKFFTQHRKLGYDIYLICQLDTMIDKNIRALVEYQYIHRQLNNFGIVGFIASLLVLRRPIICAVEIWYPMKQRISCDWLLGRKKWFRLYDTNKIFDETLSIGGAAQAAVILPPNGQHKA